MKHLVAVTLGVLVALAVAACGGNDEKTTEQAQQEGAAAEVITVRETEFALDPANPRIDRPGTVRFKVENKGGIVHALEVEGPSGESRTGDIQPGDSATLTADLDKPGTYEWYCPIGNHREQGMEGEITVGGGTGETGTTETNTTETTTTDTNTTTTNTTETEPSGGSDGSGGSGSGGSGSSGSSDSGTGGSSGGYSGGY